METVRNEFDGWHQKRGIDINLNASWHQFFLREAKDFICKNDRVFEIGCGRGDFAFWLLENFGDRMEYFEASDFSPTAIEMAKEYQTKHDVDDAVFTVHDIENLDFPDNHFDKIICFETIEHVPHPRKAVKELYRILKPGGKLLLTTPNYLNFYGIYRIYLRITGRKWTEVGQPLNNFVLLPKTKYWLRSVDFKILKSETAEFSIPWVDKKIHHFNWKSSPWNKPFGLQSFFICQKNNSRP